MFKKNRALLFGTLVFLFLVGAILFVKKWFSLQDTFFRSNQLTSQGADSEYVNTVEDATSVESSNLPNDDAYTMRLYAEQSVLEEQELNQYLRVMGIDHLLRPDVLGKPILNIDWDVQSQNIATQADSGRMISVSFENYHTWGNRWGALNIIYSTYDFSIGTEYFVYAQPSEYQKIQSGERKADILVDGKKAMVSYHLVTFLEDRNIEKRVVFPFKDHYVAFVYIFHPGDHNTEQTVKNLYQGKVPDIEKEHLENFDRLISSLNWI